MLLFKGFPGPADAAPLPRARRRQPPACAARGRRGARPDGLPGRGRAARATRCVGFVNSFSEILADDWLGAARPRRVVERRRRGRRDRIVGRRRCPTSSTRRGVPGGYADVFANGAPCASPCTRSSGRPYRGDLRALDRQPRLPAADFRLLSLFPAVHLRTNAFVIERERFLALRHRPPEHQARASTGSRAGAANMTAQLTALGRPPVVVVDGTAPRVTALSGREGDVFWQGRQEDLLVADNQTRRYAAAAWPAIAASVLQPLRVADCAARPGPARPCALDPPAQVDARLLAADDCAPDRGSIASGGGRARRGRPPPRASRRRGPRSACEVARDDARRRRRRCASVTQRARGAAAAQQPVAAHQVGAAEAAVAALARACGARASPSRGGRRRRRARRPRPSRRRAAAAPGRSPRCRRRCARRGRRPAPRRVRR